MLKLVETDKGGAIVDEKLLINENGKPTTFLIIVGALELASDIALAVFLGRTIFRKRSN